MRCDQITKYITVVNGIIFIWKNLRIKLSKNPKTKVVIAGDTYVNCTSPCEPEEERDRGPKRNYIKAT